MKTLTQYVAYLAEAMAALIIVVGAFKALWKYIQGFISRPMGKKVCLCRIQLGHSLSLSLEFLVGADILKTAITPTWQGIGQLASIIALRTVLNFFLMWELERIEKVI